MITSQVNGRVASGLSRVRDWVASRSEREKKLLAILGILLVLAGTLAVAKPGFRSALSTYKEKVSTVADLRSTEAKASRLAEEKSALESAVKRWQAVSARLSQSVEMGTVVVGLERICGECGVKLVGVKPGGAINQIFRGHLRAVPIYVKLQGTFPAVLEVLKKVEKMDNPAEVKAVKIASAQGQQHTTSVGDVTAEMLIVFYSLDPPGEEVYANGPSGRYDPFWPLKLQPLLGEIGGAQSPGGTPMAGHEGQNSSTSGQQVPLK